MSRYFTRSKSRKQKQTLADEEAKPCSSGDLTASSAVKKIKLNAETVEKEQNEAVDTLEGSNDEKAIATTTTTVEIQLDYLDDGQEVECLPKNLDESGGGDAALDLECDRDVSFQPPGQRAADTMDKATANSVSIDNGFRNFMSDSVLVEKELENKKTQIESLKKENEKKDKRIFELEEKNDEKDEYIQALKKDIEHLKCHINSPVDDVTQQKHNDTIKNPEESHNEKDVTVDEENNMLVEDSDSQLVIKPDGGEEIEISNEPQPENQNKFDKGFPEFLEVFVNQGRNGYRINWQAKIPILIKLRLVRKSWCEAIDRFLESKEYHLQLFSKTPTDSVRYPLVELNFDRPDALDRIEKLTEYFTRHSTSSLPTRYFRIIADSQECELVPKKLEKFAAAIEKYLKAAGNQILYFQVNCPQRMGYQLLWRWLQCMPKIKYLRIDFTCSEGEENSVIGKLPLELNDLVIVEYCNASDFVFVMLYLNTHIKRLKGRAVDIFKDPAIELKNLSELILTEVDDFNLMHLKKIWWKPEKLCLQFSPSIGSESIGNLKRTDEALKNFRDNLKSLEIRLADAFGWDWFDNGALNLPNLQLLQLKLESESFDLVHLGTLLLKLHYLKTVTIIVSVHPCKSCGQSRKDALNQLRRAHELKMWCKVPSLTEVTLIAKFYVDRELKIDKFCVKRPG